MPSPTRAHGGKNSNDALNSSKTRKSSRVPTRAHPAKNSDDALIVITKKTLFLKTNARCSDHFFRPAPGCHGECPPGRTLEKIVMTRRWLWLKKTVLLKTNAGPRIAFSCQPRGVIIRHSACPEFIEGNHVGKGPYAMHLRQCLHKHQNTY